MELSKIRDILRKSEDSIIFALLERSRWRGNADIYDNKPSLFSELLDKTEEVHSEMGRYKCPEEHPFTNIESDTTYLQKEYKLSSYLMKCHKNINHNNIILSEYLDKFLPLICSEGNDENSGSAAVADINLLQAISRRIHLGKVVAEVKYNEPDAVDSYAKCVDQNDFLRLLTNQLIEDAIIERVRHKANQYGGNTGDSPLNQDIVASIFREFIIPFTKNVQVDYLKLRRMEI